MSTPAKPHPRPARRSQAERRAETQSRLLSTARDLFGARGYSETSLEDIASACDVTVRPIYHYFGSKLGLFTAVTEAIEQEVTANITGRMNPSASDIWAGFMKNCEDPHFRQIILIDGPTVLGHGRMADNTITRAAREESSKVIGARPDGLTMSLLFGALSNAALYIGEHGATEGDYDKIRALVEFHSKAE